MPDKEELKQVEEEALRRMITLAARSAAPVFSQRDWRWANGSASPATIPSEARIEVTLTRLVDSARTEDATISTGRFTVARWEEDGEEHFDISLQLSEAAPNE